MDGVNIFDLIMVAIIVILGLKGLMSGFFKEAFGLIGIVGGVYFGSRYGTDAGAWISENVFHLENPNTLALVGFIAVLMAFWIAMILAGRLIGSMLEMSGLTGVDKLLGFVFGAGKIFVVASIIVYALMNITIVKTNISKYTANSFMIPIFQEVGSAILKIDNPFTQKIAPGSTPTNTSTESNQTKERISIAF